MRKMVLQAVRYVAFAWLLLFLSLPALAEKPRTHLKTYPLSTWNNVTCRAKGRFQDRGYCASKVMD